MEYIYGALLLHKAGKEINEENLKKVVAATGSHADESKIKSLIASLKNVNIDEELANANLIASTPANTGVKAEEKKPEHKEEKKEAAAEGLSALFG